MASKYLILFCCIALTGGLCLAQKPPTPKQPWTDRPTLRVWPGAAPGSEQDVRIEQTQSVPFDRDIRIVRNVSVPSLTVFQPDAGNTTGTAVLICPGGGFRMLSIDKEGYEVADWFQQHGVTAFVLKYRVAATPASNDEFMPPNLSLAEIMRKTVAPLPPDQVPMSIADGVQALKVVRQAAVKYGFSADRVVALGFSAGGTVVTGMASTATALDRPNYVAPIYAAFLPGMPAPPKDAPPFFLTVAEDDPLVRSMVMRLFNSLQEAGARPEFHVYRAGGHGFSMRELGTSDHWLQELWWWLESFGLTTVKT